MRAVTAARVDFREPFSRDGFVDAGWWPRSLDLTAELPGLLDVVWARGLEVTRLTYHLGAWDAAPRRLLVAGRLVRLGGYATGEDLTVRLADAWGRVRIDVIVIAPDTDASLAQRILALAAESGSQLRAGEILRRAGAS